MSFLLLSFKRDIKRRKYS
uniref:Uncharacterized protein n=1 Tax=Lepeophtheirus salmonis TaxID=72036 RepID=A0A0K2UF15_LEPSM